MTLNVKNKIWLGTIFLFALLLLTGGAGIYYTAVLKNESKAGLKDNYESLLFGQNMLKQMDSFETYPILAFNLFENQLKKQENNITEPGEAEATKILRSHFEQLKKMDTSQILLKAIQKDVQLIMALNLQGIYQKSAKSEAVAEKALTIIIAITAVVFLVAFTFSINFPFIVTNPIMQLSDAINQISNKNYKYRIHLANKDEFGKLADAFNTMAERLEFFESSSLNRLMFEKSRAEAVINSLKDASIGIDKFNNILFANFQALQLLGVTAPDIVGKTVNDFCQRNDLFNFLINNETTAPFKIIVDKRENYFIKENIDVNQGENNSRVIVLKNITSFKELDLAKTNFIATISHELKTPLAASDFSLKLLADERIGILTNEQKELIENIKHDNMRILKIVSEILNMSQVEAGRIQLNIQEINPYIIVTDTIDTIAASAREKNIDIEKNIEENIPNILADEEKTTWVLNNFLSNAIKYSNEGSIINISVKKNMTNVVFYVEDFGKGIEQKYLPKIFERYFQVPGTKSKGTGLGLAISKEFIEAQKGKIWVESEVGKGSVFYFSLPITNPNFVV